MLVVGCWFLFLLFVFCRLSFVVVVVVVVVVVCRLSLLSFVVVAVCRLSLLSFVVCQQARVRVPGRSPFSQLILHETDKSKVVRKTKTFSFKGQTNERINQTNSITNYPPRSSESKTRRPFRNQVIDVHWVRDTCDKSAHSIIG